MKLKRGDVVWVEVFDFRTVPEFMQVRVTSISSDGVFNGKDSGGALVRVDGRRRRLVDIETRIAELRAARVALAENALAVAVGEQARAEQYLADKRAVVASQQDRLDAERLWIPKMQPLEVVR